MNTVTMLHSSHTSAIDHLRSRDLSGVAQLTAIVGFALLTVFGAQVKIYFWEVPFTLQTLAVYGSGLFLGWKNGLFAQLLYLAIGLFFPVFAGEGFGIAYLYATASAGYLLALPLVAMLAGLMSKRWNSLAGTVLSMLVGSVVLFSMGFVWLHYAAGHATWFESFDKGWLRFMPYDLLKIVIVASIYASVRRLK